MPLFDTPITGYTPIPTSADLASPQGSSLIGHVAEGTGAVARTVQAKLRDTVSPEDFGAVAQEDGGATSQSAAITNALQSGKVVNCNGKTYVIGASVNPTDGTVAGLINGKFVRAAANQSDQNFMFDLTDQPDIIVQGNEFDFGTTENTGADDDSSRALLAVGSNDEAPATWLSGVKVIGNRFTGGGNGTALFARGLIGHIIESNTIVDRVTESATATNDNQNGIDISWGRGGIVRGNFVDGLWKRESGNLVRKFSRGILLTEQSGTCVSGNFVRNVDQGIDFSGGITVALPDGNVGCNVVGNLVTDVRTWGFKFANVVRDCVVSGNTARNWGLGGFVFSPSSVTIADPSKNTQRITVVGNTACDPTNAAGVATQAGFLCLSQPTYPSYPRGIRFVGNTVYDSTGGGLLDFGYRNDVTYDGSSGLFNELIDCRASGFVTGFSDGNFPAYVCSLGGGANQSLPNNSTENVLWPSEISDLNQMHSVSVNTNLVTVPVAGWYIVSCILAFASNATGFRRLRILKNGVLVQGAQVETAAVNGAQTGVTATAVVLMAAGDTFSIQAAQNSGGALNLVKPDCRFDVRLLDAA